MSRRRVGAAMTIVGGVVFQVALLLPYFRGSFLPGHPSLWDLTTRGPVILAVVGAVAIASAAASLATDGVILGLLAAGCSVFLFGQVFPLGALSYRLYGVGFWLAVGATIAMSLGGALALRSFAQRPPHS